MLYNEREEWEEFRAEPNSMKEPTRGEGISCRIKSLSFLLKKKPNENVLLSLVLSLVLSLIPFQTSSHIYITFTGMNEDTLEDDGRRILQVIRKRRQQGESQCEE